MNYAAQTSVDNRRNHIDWTTVVQIKGSDKVLEGRVKDMRYRIRYLAEKDAVIVAFVRHTRDGFEVEEVYLLTKDEVNTFNMKTTN